MFVPFHSISKLIGNADDMFRWIGFVLINKVVYDRFFVIRNAGTVNLLKSLNYMVVSNVFRYH